MLDDEIADIFEDEAKESKSMIVVKGRDVSDDNESMPEATARRKSNSLRLNNNNKPYSKASLPNGEKENREPIQVGGYSSQYGKAEVMKRENGIQRSEKQPAPKDSMVLSKKNSDRPDSHTTQMYENGTYHPGNDRKSSNRLSVTESDPLSQSLPSWGVSALKNEEQCVSKKTL